MATKRKRSPDTQQLDDDDFPLPGTAILLQNLSLPSGVLTTNAWGDLKEQPVTVSLELRLRDGFDTAAGLDQLDDSTIHYGELAKRVRAACKAPLALEDMLEAIEAVVRGMSRKASGRHVVRQSVIDLNMGKASMFGSGLVVSIREWYNADGTSERVQSVVTLNDVRTMTLVGINQYERSGTQPVDVTLALWRDWKLPFPNQSGLERMLIEVRSCSSSDDKMN